MSYMIMETRKAYAVALDGEGRFMKVANFGYELGDTVDSVVPLKSTDEAKPKNTRKALAATLALAACLVLALFSVYRTNFAVHGTVRISINPDVLLTVSRSERVLKTEGLNDDGRILVEQYDGRGKKRDAAVGELVELASRMGFLKPGGEVNITLNSDDAQWQSDTEAGLTQQLRPQLENSQVTVTVSDAGESVPHTVMSARPEDEGGWQDWNSFEEYSEYRIERWGYVAQQFGRDPGGALEQFGQAAGEAVENWGEFTGEAMEKWGEATGDNWEKWGEATGEAMEDWGEATGKAAEEKFGNEEYWKKFVSGGVSGESISGLINDIWSIFG